MKTMKTILLVPHIHSLSSTLQPLVTVVAETSNPIVLLCTKELDFDDLGALSKIANKNAGGGDHFC